MARAVNIHGRVPICANAHFIGEVSCVGVSICIACWVSVGGRVVD